MQIAPLDNALQGIQRGLAGASSAAAKIASAGQTNNNTPTGIADALVQLQQANIQVQASTSVQRTADAMMGTLIDVNA